MGTLSETERMIVDTVHEFVDREVKPVVRDMEHANEYPEAMIEQMKQLGIFGLAIPDELGGTKVSMPCYVQITEELARGRVEVGDSVRQTMGLVHGGVYASMAESLTSMATAMTVAADGRTAQGLSNQTSFLRPILAGTIHAEARRRHRGRTTWVWEVDITDDEGRLCALVRMTIAVRP